MSKHPIEPDAEGPADVFEALLQTLPSEEHEAWRRRWFEARQVENRRRRYELEWQRSLASVHWGGQGGG